MYQGRDEVCKVRDQKGGCKDRRGGSGITNHGIGISNFIQDQGSGCAFNVGSGITICHSFGRRVENIAHKNWDH